MTEVMASFSSDGQEIVLLGCTKRVTIGFFPDFPILVKLVTLRHYKFPNHWTVNQYISFILLM